MSRITAIAMCVLVSAACTSKTPASHLEQSVPADKYKPELSNDCRDRLGSEPKGRTFYVFFICENLDRAGPPDVALAVPRPLDPSRDTGEQVLKALFAGPSRDEKAAGFTSGFDLRTAELSFSYTREDAVGVVDLSREFLDVEFLFVPVSHFAEVVSTVGALRGVERVAILVEGEPICEKVEC